MKETYLYLAVRESESEFGRLVGYATSFLLHFALIFSILAGFDGSSDDQLFNQQIYSVTVEGGQALGGRSQVPEKKESIKAPPKNVSSQEKIINKQITEEKEVKEEKNIDNSDGVVSTAESKSTPTPAPKATLKPTVKATVKPTIAKIKATPTPNQSELSDKEYQKALQRYLGESSDAGGKNFGAAKVGGKGMGGGVVRSPEFIRYYNLLNSHIRRGWSWFDKNSPLTTRVRFKIATNGVISDVVLYTSSGNREFDESVLRALYKASPAPPPPASEYNNFKDVQILFDPRDL